jgi:hypothetical protein
MDNTLISYGTIIILMVRTTIMLMVRPRYIKILGEFKDWDKGVDSQYGNYDYFDVC